MTEPVRRVEMEGQREIQRYVVESVNAFNSGNHRLANHHARRVIELMAQHGLLQQAEPTPGQQAHSHALSTNETAVLMRQVMEIVGRANRGEFMGADAAARELVGMLHQYGVVRQ